MALTPNGGHLVREDQDISRWCYAAPYGVYDMIGAIPDELLDPKVGYHAFMAEDRLIGFRSFGPDGQVPGWEYDDSALDTGGGLQPELTGQGRVQQHRAVRAGVRGHRLTYVPERLGQIVRHQSGMVGRSG